MVNLSLGLAYVHHGLKRQSANRQYLILQGQVFISKYAEQIAHLEDGSSLSEVYYNLGRAFHLLGMTSIALKYYSLATDEVTKNLSDEGKGSDIYLSSKANEVISLLSVSNQDKALQVIKESIVL
jgi:general transcription factor 3C polypeptide 3 (transcription factor C subunit 4)